MDNIDWGSFHLLRVSLSEISAWNCNFFKETGAGGLTLWVVWSLLMGGSCIVVITNTNERREIRLIKGYKPKESCKMIKYSIEEKD